MTTSDPRRGPIGPEAYPEETSVPHSSGIKGMPVEDPAGTRIGTVADTYVDVADGYLRYIQVEGDAGTSVLPVDGVREAGDHLVVPYTAEALGASPGVEGELTPEREERLYAHFGRPGYWEDIRARQTTPAMTPEVAEAEGEHGEALRARQTSPAMTPELAEAEADRQIRRHGDSRGVRVRRWGL